MYVPLKPDVFAYAPLFRIRPKRPAKEYECECEEIHRLYIYIVTDRLFKTPI